MVVGAIATDRPAPRADFTFVNRGDVTTLDLQRMSWMQDLRVARILFEGLVRLDVFTHEYGIEPGVADRWEVSDDGLVYTFHLRENARWSNGEPVTADDFVFSWRRALLPDTASDYTGLFQLIRGGKEFFEWRAAALAELARSGPDIGEARRLWAETERRFAGTIGLRAVDARTLRVELVRPTPYFLDLCAFPVFYPVYPPLVRRHETLQPDGRIEQASGWTKPPHLVSNGAFRLTVWRYKRDMRFERNEHYWDAANIAIDSIAIPSIEDPNAQVLAFTSGSVDWTSDVTPAYRAEMLAEKRRFYEEHRETYERLRAMGLDQFEIDRRLPNDPRAHIHAVPSFGTYFYNFNCRPRLDDGRENPFRDARVRRAFAMAVDKRALVEQVRRCGEPAATTLIPPGSIGGYDSPAGLPFDPARARALLAEAGWPDPSKFPTVEILFNKDGGHDLIAQAVAKDWQRNLGVSVSLGQKEVKIIRDDLKNGNFMVSRAGWYGDYGDPTTFLDINRSDDGNNDRKYSNPAYDALLDRAAMERDPARRMDLLEEAERIIVDEDVPLLPLFHYVTIYLFDAHRISGINAHPRVTQSLYLVDVLGDGKGPDTSRALPPRPAADDGAAHEGDR